MSIGNLTMDSSVSDFPIKTARLQFIPKSKSLSEEENKTPSRLREHLSAELSTDWPPEFVAPPVTEHAEGWMHSYLLYTDGDKKTVAGIAGHKKWAPDQKTLQIGGTFVPLFHRKRLGEEVAAALGTWGLAQPGIERVICDVPDQHKASAKSLERAGFVQCDEKPASGFLRFEMKRANH